MYNRTTCISLRITRPLHERISSCGTSDINLGRLSLSEFSPRVSIKRSCDSSLLDTTLSVEKGCFFWEMARWAWMKLGFEMIDFHDLHTDLHRRSESTGSHERISKIKSSARWLMDAILVFELVVKSQVAKYNSTARINPKSQLYFFIQWVSYTVQLFIHTTS